MNITFRDAMSEAMYVATRKSHPKTMEYFRDYFEQMLWGYSPSPNFDRATHSTGLKNRADTKMWECLIWAGRNDLVDRDTRENPVAWEFSWMIRSVECDPFNHRVGGGKETTWMNGGLVNHASDNAEEPDWSIHT